jgi:hypothetical protein
MSTCHYTIQYAMSHHLMARSSEGGSDFNTTCSRSSLHKCAPVQHGSRRSQTPLGDQQCPWSSRFCLCFAYLDGGNHNDRRLSTVLSTGSPEGADVTASGERAIVPRPSIQAAAILSTSSIQAVCGVCASQSPANDGRWLAGAQQAAFVSMSARHVLCRTLALLTHLSFTLFHASQTAGAQKLHCA